MLYTFLHLHYNFTFVRMKQDIFLVMALENTLILDINEVFHQESLSTIVSFNLVTQFYFLSSSFNFTLNLQSTSVSIFNFCRNSTRSSRRTSRRITITHSTNRVRCSTITAITIIIMAIGTGVAVGPITGATLTKSGRRNLLPDDNGLVISTPPKSGLVSSSLFR